ncbi:hypothetical protein JAAARDRAFT_140994 [Jaapia argillacea MUCL 33604]|uniref:Uncharacterized protein n=1 Tax=Jaapia argillacea MUCL 33604 TaxID=933084 RepID=A0A067P832_9AGAM|nr:hypothetical protein JAAARDRAFT_140994 [Jaapia argillacea MUCL 33604]
MTSNTPSHLITTPRHHKCLVRDDYRCVITGGYDTATFLRKRKKDRTFVAPAPPCYTQLAHIIAESTNADIQAGGLKRNYYAASAWAVLDRFGKVDVEDDQLNGEGIHRLTNVMTMCLDAQASFDGLQLWLEQIGNTNRYRVCVTESDLFQYLGLNPSNPEIELTTTDPDLPLPDPRILRLHAACAKVAHLSGAGEIVDETLRDIEELKVLAYDGGSAHVLTAALLKSHMQIAVR